ncbi:MAG: hypothetical protein IKQ41_05995 [Clostridia bacterium]|nr:hypothetical protein [Clostridia bacterium]
MAEDRDERRGDGQMPADGEEKNAVQAPEKQGRGGDGGRRFPFLGFVGSFPHSIDAKGRMIIPAAFRDALGDRFAVAPSPDFKAVALYPIEDWIARRDELVALTKKRPVAQPFLDEFTKYSYTDCESDAQGRLLLPQRIRAWRLGDARDVEVNGAFNHIRIIPASVGKDQDRTFDEKYPDPLAFLTALQDGSEF